MSKININDIHSFFESNQSYVTIWCEDPETNKERVGGLFGIEKSYLTYRILMRQVGRDVIGVRHRYSEFETLRNLLNEKYGPMGILVPALPPKNQVTSLLNKGADGIFVKERTIGLTLFCDSIVANPFLRNDSHWKEFMRPNAGTKGADSTDYSNNIGESMLNATFAFMDLPFRDRMDQKMFDLKEEVTHITRNAQVCLDKAKALQAAERNMQQASEALHSQMQAWTDVETSIIKNFNGQLPHKSTGIISEKELLPNTFKKFSTFLVDKHLSSDDCPDYDSVFLIATLEHELSRMEAIKDLFKIHDAYKSNIESLSIKLMKAESGKGDRVMIPQLKKELEESNQCLIAFYKGLMYFTLPMCCRQRSANFRKSSSYLVSSYVSVATGIQNACFKFFTDMKISIQESNNDACNILSLLSMKQFGHFPEVFPDIQDTLAAPEPAFKSLFTFAVEGTRANTYTVTQTTSSVESDYKPYSTSNTSNTSNTSASTSSSSISSSSANNNTKASTSNSENSSDEARESSPPSPASRPVSASVAIVPTETVKSYEATEKSNALLADLLGEPTSGKSGAKDKGLWD